MNISNVLTAICSLLFFMIGADKFLYFLEPPCSLEESIPPIMWNLFGVLQIASGILIWLPNFRKYISGIFAVYMLIFIIIHLFYGTYDIGGAAFMAVLLALLYLNPTFIRAKSGA